LASALLTICHHSQEGGQEWKRNTGRTNQHSDVGDLREVDGNGVGTGWKGLRRERPFYVNVPFMLSSDFETRGNVPTRRINK
jgi:hypothetical protein